MLGAQYGGHRPSCAPASARNPITEPSQRESGVADQFPDDAGDGCVAVGMEFGDELDKLAAGNPDEPV
jgi:hypothetical protein